MGPGATCSSGRDWKRMLFKVSPPHSTPSSGGRCRAGPGRAELGRAGPGRSQLPCGGRLPAKPGGWGAARGADGREGGCQQSPARLRAARSGRPSLRWLLRAGRRRCSAARSRPLAPLRRARHGVSAPRLQRLHRARLGQVPAGLALLLVLQRYRCDDFVVNDTKLGLVQKVREHLQNLENSAFTSDRHRKRKLLENSSLNSKLLKVNGSTTALCATGLRNLGNTCFMNAILQSLSNIQQFCCYFKELPAVELRNGKTAGRRTYHTRSQGDNNVSLVEEFRKTLCALWQGSQTAFSPESLFYVVWKIMPNFRGYQQQDAHEFMRYLLDHLHLELQGGFNVSRSVILQENSNLSASNKCCINGASTVVTAIFGGILQNEVNCLICGTESRKFDPFLDLSLDIPSQFRNKRTKNQESGPMCTLRDCLRSFTDLEELDETELYMCHKCKKKQKSTKKFWIQKLPKVLCLHLKRFHWTAYLRNKVDTYVEFPLRGLDMKCYLLEPENSGPESCLYDLVAVVVHHGSGVGSGHYTAYAAHEGRWFHFNDSTVTLTDEETVGKAKAYILFYVERQAKPGAEKL
ncbi:ubiquitin carboxyl-terminal hydrolase 3 isoform X3 [Anomalospiza imberbis]|uniref:ubiquitin carboxyl-terminal hydrolase 3 isoform X3 n=1 Tax=Anomalospiza imberbis TaxID=187417 RepID=UPI00358ED3CD